MPATDGITGHHGDNGFGQGADLALEVEDVQPGDSVVAHISALPAHSLISPRTEGFRALACQNDDAYVGIVARIGECERELFDGLGTERVAHLRAIDGDLGNAF